MYRFCLSVLVFSHAVCQVQELHSKLSEESRRADNLAYEMKKLEEKHETVMKEKEVRQLLKCVRKTCVTPPVVTKKTVYTSLTAVY